MSSHGNRAGSKASSEIEARARITILVVCGLALAVTTASTASQASTHQELVTQAYDTVMSHSTYKADRFNITLSGFQEIAAEDLDDYPALEFLSLPGYEEGRIAFSVGSNASGVYVTPRWRESALAPQETEGTPPPGYEELASMSVFDAVSLEESTNPIWNDLASVTRYHVHVHLDDRTDSGGGDVHELTYTAAAFWFDGSGGESEMAIVDWGLISLESVLRYLRREANPDGDSRDSLATLSPAGGAPTSSCIVWENSNYDEHTVPLTVGRESHIPEGTVVIFPPFPISFVAPDSFHRGGIDMHKRCVCKPGCQSTCEITFSAQVCEEATGDGKEYPPGVLTNSNLFHVPQFLLKNSGRKDNHGGDSYCGAGFACGVIGCLTPFCVTDGITITILEGGPSPVEISVDFEPPEEEYWDLTEIFPNRVKWETFCPECRPLFNVSGTVRGEIPEETGEVVIALDSPGSADPDAPDSAVHHEEVITASNIGPINFGAQFVEDTVYTISKVSENCVTCTLGPEAILSGTAVDHIGGITVDCEAAPTPGEQCDPPPSPPEDHYFVTAEVLQQEPYDPIELRLEADTGPGGSLEVVETQHSESGSSTSYVTFNTALPDGTDFIIVPDSPDPEETCEATTNRILGADKQVPVYCYTLTPPPPPPIEWPGICDIVPSLCRTCHTIHVSIEEVPCPPETEAVLCDRTVVRSVCFDLGAFFNTASLQMTLPETDGAPIQNIDDSLPLVASATHPGGILRMGVLLDGELLASYPAPGSPTSFDLPVTSLDTSDLAEGAHAFGLYAVTDGPGGPVAVGRSKEFIVDHQGGGGGPDTTPPTVSISDPPDQAELEEGTVVVTATAADASGIDRVEFFRNGINQGIRHTDTTPPYQWSWSAVPGSHALDVRAVDASPNANSTFATRHYVHVVESTPSCGDTEDPTVSLTSPADGSTHDLGVPLTVAAVADDNVGVTRVEFYRDNALIGTREDLPVSITWTPQQAGSHDLTAKAYDACDNEGTSPVRTVQVVNNPCSGDSTGPTLDITAPPEGSPHNVNSTVTFSADAFDAGSGVDRVEFDIEGGPLLTDDTAPYEVTWQTPAPVPGDPTIEGERLVPVTAYDGCGNSTTEWRTIIIECQICGGPQTEQ